MKQMAPVQQHAIPVVFSAALDFSQTPESTARYKWVRVATLLGELETALIFKVAFGSKSVS